MDQIFFKLLVERSRNLLLRKGKYYEKIKFRWSIIYLRIQRYN